MTGHLAAAQGWRRFQALLFVLLCVALAGYWLALQRAVLEQIPPGVVLQQLDVGLSVGGSVVIGRRELGQRGGLAEDRHLRLARDPQGWNVSNVATSRRVLLDYGGFGELYLRRWVLRAGDRLRLGRSEFAVTAVDAQRLIELRSGDIRYRVHHSDGLAARVEAVVAGQGQPPSTWLDDAGCGIERGGLGVVREWFRQLEFWAPGTERPMISFGGGADCSDRIAVPSTGPDALRLVYRNGVVFLAPGRGGGAPALFKRRDDTGWQGFADIERPLVPGPDDRLEGRPFGPLRSMIVGRTYYRVEPAGGDAGAQRLLPFERVHRFYDLGTGPLDAKSLKRLDQRQLNEDLMRAPAAVRGQLSESSGPMDGWTLLPGLDRLGQWVSGELPRGQAAVFEREALALLLGLIAMALFRWRPFSRRGVGERRGSRAWVVIRERSWLNAGLVGVAGFVVALLIGLGAYRDDVSRLDIAWLLAVGWLAASLSVARTPERDWRLMLFWLSMSGIVLIGSMTLELLGQGAHASHWSNYDLKHSTTLAVAFLVTTLVLGLPMETWRDWFWGISHPNTRARKLGRWGAVLLLVAAFVAWLLFGREEGLGAFQPIEFGKFVAVFVLAVATASVDLNRQFARFHVQIGRFLGGLLLFVAAYAALFVAIPALKSDYSPILILVVLGIVMLVLLGAWLLVHRLTRRSLQQQRWSTAPGQRELRPRWLPWFALRRPRWMPGMELVVIAVSLCLAVVLVWTIGSEMEAVDVQRSQGESVEFSTPAQRVAVYYAVKDVVGSPGGGEFAHPDLGGQLLKSFGVIATAPCYAWERDLLARDDAGGRGLSLVSDSRACTQAWSGIELSESGDGHWSPGAAVERNSAGGAGLNPPRVMALPAVQDDFIMAFLIHRFGVTTAVILALLQVALLWLMIDTALTKYAWGLGDYADDATRQVICFLTLGGAGLLALHWVVSWGNVFGLLPVMGQPMTWVSVANSHLIGMGIPILASTLVTLRLPDGRSRVLMTPGFGPPDLGVPLSDWLRCGWRRIIARRERRRLDS